MRAEGCKQSCHTIGQPADQVAYHHCDNHHQHPLFSATGHHWTHAADLTKRKRHFTDLLSWCQKKKKTDKKTVVLQFQQLVDFSPPTVALISALLFPMSVPPWPVIKLPYLPSKSTTQSWLVQKHTLNQNANISFQKPKHLMHNNLRP